MSKDTRQKGDREEGRKGTGKSKMIGKGCAKGEREPGPRGQRTGQGLRGAEVGLWEETVRPRGIHGRSSATRPPGLLAPVHSDLGRLPSGPSGGVAVPEGSTSCANSPGSKGDAGNRDLIARRKTTNWGFRGHIGIKIQKEATVKI